MLFLLIFIIELIFLFFLSQFLIKSISRLVFHFARSQNSVIQFIAFLFLPGVIIHELSHFLAASVLFVKCGEIEFLPKVAGDSLKLGSVQIAKTDILRRMLIGIAPILIGTTLIIGIPFYFWSGGNGSLNVYEIILVLYVVFIISNTMFSSKKDTEGLLEFLLTIGFLALVLFFAGFRLPLNWMVIFLNENVLSLFKKMDTLLIIPLFLDIIIIGLTHLFFERSRL